MNLCINCKWFMPSLHGGTAYAKCGYPNSTRIELVGGESVYPYCEIERKYKTDPETDRTRCGEKGWYFAAKEAAA